jgi:hypothetical protein
VEEDECRLRDTGVVRDAPLQRHREKRLGRVRDAALEEPEVGAADVDEVSGSALGARGDGQEGHNQADAEGDAGGREERPHGSSQ